MPGMDGIRSDISSYCPDRIFFSLFPSPYLIFPTASLPTTYCVDPIEYRGSSTTLSLNLVSSALPYNNHRKYMRSHFLEEGLSSSQEALLIPRLSRSSISESLFSMSAPAHLDLERGHGALKPPTDPIALPLSPSSKPVPSPNNPQQPSNPSKSTTHLHQSQHRPLSSQPSPSDPDAIPPKLLKLRTVIGITTPPSLLPTQRPAPNLGIYTRIIHEERTAKFQFYFAASVINVCYFGQICIAAALTALGASGSSNVAITVLGAANTVLAGVLTYLKGQGLPTRLRHYWTALRKCREFIEEVEREVEAEEMGGVGEKGGKEEGVDVEGMIETIVRMYHDVRQTAEGMFFLFLLPHSSSYSQPPHFLTHPFPLPSPIR